MLFETFTGMVNKLRSTGLKGVPGIEKSFSRIYRMLEPTNCTKLVKVEDFEMFVDIRDMGDVGTSLRKKHTYHPQMTKVIREVIKPGMSCVDIGANIGYFTIIMSRLVGPTGFIYAYEPDETNFGLLQRNLDINNSRNVLPRMLGISNFYGEVDFYVDKINFGGHSLVRKGKIYATKSIPVATLDSLLKVKKVNLVKIDVEGTEPEVLEGMDSILDANPNIILIIEYLPNMNSTEHLEKLVSRGLKFWHINEFQRATLPITPFLIKKLWGQEPGMNLLVRRDRSDEIYEGS